MPKLDYGKSPLHRLTHDELLIVANRMYSALVSSQCVIRQSADNLNPYWGKNGTGGVAAEKVNQALQSASGDYTDDDIYQAYFRSADDLLFNCSEYDIGFNWMVCEQCGRMYGHPDRDSSISCLCGNDSLRPIQWSDLQME